MAGCSSSARPRLALLLGTLVAACGHEPGPRPRLVLLYAPCTVRKDFLAPYDAHVHSTPALAAFARQSAVFGAHVTETAQSGVAFASLLTGTHADRHGVYFHPAPLAEDNVTLAEAFGAAGYTTWFWSGQPMASATLGYGQGVAPEHVLERELRFQPDPQPLAPGTLERMAADDDEFRALLADLAAHPDQHAFVQVCFTVSHEPYHQYVSPAEIAAFAARFPDEARGVTPAEIERWLPVYEQHRHRLNWDFPAARAELALGDEDLERLAAVIEVAYRASLAQLDGFFGDVLSAIDAAGLADEALVAFTSDHGELLWRANALFPWTHGMELAPEELYVPWLVRAPGLAPQAYASVTRSIDVFPTLLGLCRLPVPPTVVGTDLAPALRGEERAPERQAFSHNSTLGERRLERFADMDVLERVMPAPDPARLWTSVRAGPLFLRRQRVDPDGWRMVAYDHARDPGELHDVFDPKDAIQAALAAELERYQSRLVQAYGRERGGELDEEAALERLRALGYVR